jgi:hypothetical protein
MARASLWLVVAALCAALASAHLCLLQPMQRGGVEGSGEIGAKACFGVTAPCGNYPKAGPISSVAPRGTMTLVQFQKNEDHYNAENPGNFSIVGWNGAFAGPPIATLADNSAPSLTVFTVSLWTPMEAPPGNYTLQVVYYTNNPNAPPAFYACADVQVV